MVKSGYLPLKIENKAKMSAFMIPIQIVLEVLASTTDKKNKIICIQVRNGESKNVFKTK